MYECFACVYVYAPVHSWCSRKLEEELQAVVSCHIVNGAFLS